MTTTQTVADFVAKHGITMTSERTYPDKSKMKDKYEREAFHFSCTFRRAGSMLDHVTTFTMGAGHAVKNPGTGKMDAPTPNAAEVLDCLRSDAQSVDNARDFEDWASDLGYDTDSRKAYAVWEACKEEGRKLRFFLGDDLYRELMDCEPM
jgi:hypothetical protein